MRSTAQVERVKDGARSLVLGDIYDPGQVVYNYEEEMIRLEAPVLREPQTRT